jgi:Glycosyltransferase family 87
MTRERLDGLYLLVLGCLVFLALGFALENAQPNSLADFKALYYPARCLIEHGDPYNRNEVMRVYSAENGNSQQDTEQNRQIATQNPYPPTAFPFTVPLALLPWGPAHFLWTAINVGSFLFASILIWNLAEGYAPTLTGAMLCFFLANSELLILCGNVAGLVISLCVIAVWCFFRERFVWLGIVCLAISLALKPHDTGLIWLFFLLAGGLYRKRALQTLLVTAAVSLPALLWISIAAPHWLEEMRFNLQTYAAHGGINDPGPASIGGHGLDMLISLQTIFSVFWDNPRFYNIASYLVCAPLLLIWAFVTIRSRPSPKRLWLGLATIAALSMLPIYHRQLDAKLLMLTIPACAMLWSEGGLTGRLALLVNGAGLVLIGDLPWAILLVTISHLHLSGTALSRQASIALQVFPIPLILLGMSVFYLWVYARSCLTLYPQARGTVSGI